MLQALLAKNPEQKKHRARPIFNDQAAAALAFVAVGLPQEACSTWNTWNLEWNL